eukprot:1612456-Prymnesium_polylepis.1
MSTLPSMPPTRTSYLVATLSAEVSSAARRLPLLLPRQRSITLASYFVCECILLIVVARFTSSWSTCFATLPSARAAVPV